MAGRKTWKHNAPKTEISQTKEDSLPRRNNKKSSIHLISPNGELRQRLIETVIDVKENIPSECTTTTRRITRSFQMKLDTENESESSVLEPRKRRSVQIGPPPKRASIEKLETRTSEENDAKSSGTSRSTSSTSCSSKSGKSSSSGCSRARGVPLPVMEEEEDEVFNSSIEEVSKDDLPNECYSNENTVAELEEYEYEKQSEKDYDESDGIDEEEQEEEYENEEENENDPKNAPLQNVSFASMKRHMNEISLMVPPVSMKEEKCDGIGSPDEVWSLMVSRDDLARASKCLLSGHPEMTVNMRSMLIDWMMEVCDSENLHRETFHLAVDYVDRFLESDTMRVTQETFQLAGTAALFIASKYEEIYPPKCVDFACLTDGAFNSDAVRRMEVVMVKSLNWTLGPITSIHWLSTYLQLLGRKIVDEENEHVYESNYFVPELMREDFIHMAKILDFLLFEMDSLSFTYRTISAAVLFACYEPRDAVENATGFNYDQLLPVIDFVDPVVTVFEKLRQAGDPFPINDRIQSDDIHNMQTHIKYDDIRTEVKREREARQSSCPSGIYSYHSSTSIVASKQFYN